MNKAVNFADVNLSKSFSSALIEVRSGKSPLNSLVTILETFHQMSYAPENINKFISVHEKLVSQRIDRINELQKRRIIYLDKTASPKNLSLQYREKYFYVMHTSASLEQSDNTKWHSTFDILLRLSEEDSLKRKLFFIVDRDLHPNMDEEYKIAIYDYRDGNNVRVQNISRSQEVREVQRVERVNGRKDSGLVAKGSIILIFILVIWYLFFKT